MAPSPEEAVGAKSSTENRLTDFDFMFEPGDHQDYVAELTRCTLKRLEREPAELREKKTALQAEIQDLGVKNYSVFLNFSARVAENTQSALTRIKEKTEVLETALPKLIQNCDRFTERAREITKQRNTTRAISDSQAKVVEILELPLTMRRCVQNRLFQEALDLLEYGRSLAKRLGGHGDGLPVLTRVVREMEQISEGLLADLLRELEGRITLPACLRVVGFLRRLDAFEPAEAREEFLRRRSVWYRSVAPDLADGRLKTMTSTEALEFLDAYLKEARTGLFDIITHYRGIFVQQADLPPATKSGAPPPAPALLDDPLLRIWVHDQARRLVRTVARVAPRLETGAQLRSAVDASMYCGSSLGRVGVDFRGLVVPALAARGLSLLGELLSDAVEQFDAALSSHDWHITANVLAELGVSLRGDALLNGKDAKPSDADDDDPADGAGPAEPTPAKPSADGALRPPARILELPPLAVLTNGVLKALQNYSMCCAYYDYNNAAALVTQCVEAAVQLLLERSARARALSKAESPRTGTSSADPTTPAVSARESGTASPRTGMHSQLGALRKLTQGLVDDLVPFTRRALRIVFGLPVHGAAGSNDFFESRLTTEKLVESLQGLYPPPRSTRRKPAGATGDPADPPGALEPSHSRGVLPPTADHDDSDSEEFGVQPSSRPSTEAGRLGPKDPNALLRQSEPPVDPTQPEPLPVDPPQPEPLPVDPTQQPEPPEPEEEEPSSQQQRQPEPAKEDETDTFSF